MNYTKFSEVYSCELKSHIKIYDVSFSLLLMFIVAIFALGCRNVYQIIYKQQFYQSMAMTTQYFFGQTLLVLRIDMFTLMWVVAKS